MPKSKTRKAKVPTKPVRMPQRSDTIAGKESQGLKPICRDHAAKEIPQESIKAPP